MWHRLLLFKRSHGPVVSQGQWLRQREQPVEVMRQTADLFLRNAHRIKALDDTQLPLQPRLVVALRLKCLQMRDHETSERVVAARQPLQAVRHVQQLDRSKAKIEPSSEEAALVSVRSPAGVSIAQNCQTDYRTLAEKVEDAVAVLQHPKRESLILLRLDLDVHQHPCLAAIQEKDLDQPVHGAAAALGLARNGSKFLLQEVYASFPVDSSGQVGQKEGGERGEALLGKHVFPRPIQIIADAWTRTVTARHGSSAACSRCRCRPVIAPREHYTAPRKPGGRSLPPRPRGRRLLASGYGCQSAPYAGVRRLRARSRHSYNYQPAWLYPCYSGTCHFKLA